MPTAYPGKTRLFHRWQGANITGAYWKPTGIAMIADPGFGETEGGLQAPHVIKVGKINNAVANGGIVATAVWFGEGDFLRPSTSPSRISPAGSRRWAPVWWQYTRGRAAVPFRLRR